jgi:hypothetical protein
LDALFWTVSERDAKSNFLSAIFHLIVAVIYALCHTFLILLQVVFLVHLMLIKFTFKGDDIERGIQFAQPILANGKLELE